MCPTGKKPLTAYWAKMVARRQRRSYDLPIQAYPCHVCSRWHTGGQFFGDRPKTKAQKRGHSTR